MAAGVRQRPGLALLHRTNTAGLTSTTFLPGAGMVAIAPAVCRKHIGECRCESTVIRVNTIADRRSELHRIGQDANHCARGDVDYVIDRTPALRKARQVASKEAQSLLAGCWSWRNAGVEPEQICNRSHILWPTTWTDRSHVLHEREQVRPRCRRNRDVENRRIQMGEERIEEEIGKLAVILGIIDAKAIFEASADNQLVDQGVAFTVDLLPLSLAIDFPRDTMDRDPLPVSFAVGADDSLLVARAMDLAVHSQHADGNFKNNGVDVEARNRIGSVVALIVRIDVGWQNPPHPHAEVKRVEGSAEVDVERIIDRSGKHSHAVSQVIDALVEQVLILRHGEWPYVGRHGQESATVAEFGGHTVLHHRDGVGLAQAQSLRT